MPYLTMDPIAWNQIGEWMRKLAQEYNGAAVLFVGIVRADEDQGRRVAALDYGAYPEMAEFQLGRLIDEVRGKWPHAAVRLQHRVGVVRVGELGLAVLAAAAHRAEAYAVSRFVVERIKQDVPIWKKIRYDDETAVWMTKPRVLCEQVLEEAGVEPC